MFNKFFLLLLSFALLFSSCTTDDEASSRNFGNGTFIVNQGAFIGGTGSISFVKDAEVIEDVYTRQNKGFVLGSIAQSIHKFNQKYYIAVNNAAKIVVVNADNFKFTGEVSLSLPRYFVTSGTKLYATSWTSDFKTGFINLIDPNTLKVQKSVAINGLAEKMIEKNGLIYITVTAGKTEPLNGHVVVYDTQKEAIQETIKLGDNSNDIVLDKNGDIWVICSGFTNYPDSTQNTKGSIHKIVGNKSVFSKPLSNGAKGMVTNASKDKVYFLMDRQVFDFDPINTNNNPKPIATGAFDAMFIDTQNDHIYLTDVKDYQQKGDVKVINTQGNAVKTINAGVIPGFVYFSN
jgi:hypothetical protein